MADESITKDVLLTRLWSGHEAGEIVTVWEVTADSMVRKGYGRIVGGQEEPPKAQKKRRRGRPRKRPVVETADATPVETETVTVEPMLNEVTPSEESEGD